MKTLILRRIQQVRNLGPAAAARVIWSRISARFHGQLLKWRSSVFPPGLGSWREEVVPNRIVPVLELLDDGAAARWCAHRFDLLGSGPVDMNLKTIDPRSDIPRSWSPLFDELRLMLPADYMLIDWQKDPKGGHRWSAKCWHKEIKYGTLDGVDIKWPWELSRLQHLPALAARLASSGPVDRGLLESEIRAEIIDFVMQNPPNFGVNWVCAMDVGIRAANLALSVDLARAAGVTFDEAFLKLVSSTLRDHGRFLVGNLEWHSKLCSNHYLADVVGLLYVASYLTQDRESDEWLIFSGREIVSQVLTQFHAEGTNFEASTSYHRLSSEMAIYGATMMLSNASRCRERVIGWWSGPVRNFHPQPASPPLRSDELHDLGPKLLGEAFEERLRGMASFTVALLRTNGSVPLIGDEDSGRFFRLESGVDPYRDILDHRHLPASAMALFCECRDGDDSREAQWIRHWMGCKELRVFDRKPDNQATWFPSFGLYVWNRNGIRVTFRCGNVGQNGNGGHAHCDQLALTFDIFGEAVIVDSGTGVYTPYPEVRNRFRSAAAHSGIVVDRCEPNDWLPGRWGLFGMNDRSRGIITNLGPDFVEAEHRGYGYTVSRKLRFTKGSVMLSDYIPPDLSGAYMQFVLAPGVLTTIEGGVCYLEPPGSSRRLAIAALDGTLKLGSGTVSEHYGSYSETQIIRVDGRQVEFFVPER